MHCQMHVLMLSMPELFPMCQTDSKRARNGAKLPSKKRTDVTFGDFEVNLALQARQSLAPSDLYEIKGGSPWKAVASSCFISS